MTRPTRSLDPSNAAPATSPATPDAGVLAANPGRRRRRAGGGVALAGLGVLCALGLPARAADAEAQRMIEALRPAQAAPATQPLSPTASPTLGAQPAPAGTAEAAQPGPAQLRTRGLRNLRVEAAPGQANAAAAAAAVAPTAPGAAGAPGASGAAGASAVVEAPVPAGPRSLSLTIGFEFDSAQITATSADTLASLAQALQSPDLQALTFRIEGHTDRRGRPDYNLRLSQQRAEAVRAHLEKLGVPTVRLMAEGRGDTDPANPGDPLAAENRRVRIVTLSR